jgi:hypothetical protein
MYLKLTGGDYVFPLTTVAPHQTTVIDVRKLRDTQVPDVNGQTIPAGETRGQVQWSLTGGVDRVVIGRSEQVDLVRGISSNYACQNCCPNNFYDGWLTPAQSSGFEGDQLQFIAMQQDMNCYGQVYPAYQAGIPTFTSSDLSICNPDWNTGTTTGVGPGETSIFASWTADAWLFTPTGDCDYTPAEVLRDAICEVLAGPRIDDITPGLGPVDSQVGISIVGSGFGSSPSVSAGGVISTNVQSSSETSISVTLNISANASAGNHSITVTANGRQSNSVNFFVQIPTKLQRNSISALQNQGGCGAVRNLSYTLLDQNGDPIDTNGTISEGISGFSSSDPNIQPPPETQRTMSHGTFPDVVGYNISSCPPPFTATFTQSFTVHLNTAGHAWALSSQNSVSMGRTSAGAKFVDITFSQ